MAGERVVRVLPDVVGITKTFDYLVPEALGDQVRVGTMVRVALHGRRIGGWVVEDDVEPPEGVVPVPVAKVRGWGPPPAVLDLAHWAAWRWAGRPAHLLRTASPETAVRTLPPPRPSKPVDPVDDPLVTEALSSSLSVLRQPPDADRFPLVAAVADRGDALILTPTLAMAATVARRLQASGRRAVLLADAWPVARAGGGVTVVGARTAAFAPLPRLGAALVLDAHDEAYRQEQSLTWSAVDVVVERCRRDGAPCVLSTSVPTLDLLALDPVLVAPPRPTERDGWPAVEVVDLRATDPAEGRFPRELLEPLRAGLAAGRGPVVCVLNRKGRARLLACGACRATARCERCQAAVEEARGADVDPSFALVCGRCGERRPRICDDCGSQRLKVLRVGVSRVREDLERLLGVTVAEVTGDDGDDVDLRTPVLVGTEAVLHRVRQASVVAFLDIDQELLAPRFRAVEEALALLARAGRLARGRARGGRVVVLTSLPDHDVLQAVVHGDPARVVDGERQRRRDLGLPPFAAVAQVSGAGAAEVAEQLRGRDDVQLLGPDPDARWLVKAADWSTLADALATLDRPAARTRIEVDPVRA